MSKKLISLLLVFMILFSFVLSSCSVNSTSSGEDPGEDTKEPENDPSNRTPYTLTLWLPAQKGTTEAAVQEVENAINKILNSSYTTSIELRTFDEDEYVAAVLDKIDAIEQKIRDDQAESSRRKEIEASLRQEGIVTVGTTAAQTEETDIATEVNTYGQSQKKYPDVGEYQFDIFLITSYEMYRDLVDRDALMSLEDNLKGSSKALKSRIYPAFLDAVKFDVGLTYAIPNNHGMGEYKFLLTNKELAEKYYFDPADLTGSIDNCKYFIDTVARYEEDPDVSPLLSWVDPVGMKYWSRDGSWSALASIVGNDASYDSAGSISNIFTNSAYKAHFKMMKEFEEAGMIAEDPENCEKFAVGVVSADCLETVEALYGDEYDISIYEYPRATQEELFTGAFAVSAATKSLSRAMEVITAINTQSEVRNLLQYGVEGVHYNLNEEGLVERVRDENGNSAYNMNILHTGNTYIAYPEEGMDPQQWEHDKQRNLDTILTPFSYCYNSENGVGLYNKNNAENFDEISRISAEIYERLMKVKAEDVDDFFAEAAAEMSANDMFKQMAGASWEYGIVSIYSKYYNAHFAKPDDEGGGENAGAEAGADAE